MNNLKKHYGIIPTIPERNIDNFLTALHKVISDYNAKILKCANGHFVIMLYDDHGHLLHYASFDQSIIDSGSIDYELHLRLLESRYG